MSYTWYIFPSLCDMYCGITKFRQLMETSCIASPVIVAILIGWLFESNTGGSSLALYVNFGIVNNRLIATLINAANWVWFAVGVHPSLEIKLKVAVSGMTLSALFPSFVNPLLFFTEKCRLLEMDNQWTHLIRWLPICCWMLQPSGSNVILLKQPECWFHAAPLGQWL